MAFSFGVSFVVKRIYVVIHKKARKKFVEIHKIDYKNTADTIKALAVTPGRA
jgi:hypothetical protein